MRSLSSLSSMSPSSLVNPAMSGAIRYDLWNLSSNGFTMNGSLSFRSGVASTSGLRGPSVGRIAPAVAARTPLCVENRVAIRFSRFGRRKAPVYRIIAIDSRKRRDGRPLEWLGYYDPISKAVNLDAPNIKKWIGEGAQPSEAVSKLLKRAMVIE